ncbi:MAG: hypothetical protein JWQ11_2784, partial [Rhizobacter sp.]|nr:hypothetical protein [Rhizobacter sp.]
MKNSNFPVARAAAFYGAIAASQAVVIAGINLGWSAYAIVGGGLACVAVAAVMADTAVRSLLKTVNDVSHHVIRMSQGDLSTTIDVGATGGSASALNSLKTLQAELRKTIGAIRSGSHEVSTASTEIATGNQDLSQRTEQTASNLQQTASSLSQLTGNVRQSADAAAQANQLASSATQVARRGGAVVSQVVSTMEEINSSSKKIADIIGVIDGIAFQTNILALNAAVEA